MTARDGDGPVPVPTGLQQLLHLASVDDLFCTDLIREREALAAAAGVALTASEVAILRAAPEAQLRRMVASLPPVSSDRRTFLSNIASTALLVLGGGVLVSSASACVKGSRADVPGPREPAHAPTAPSSPFGATPARPSHNEMQGKGGSEPSVPKRKPDAGVKGIKRRRRPPVGTGSRPDVPRTRGDDEGGK